MTEMRHTVFVTNARRPYAVVLGTDEIASAIAVALHRAGWRTAMAHDPGACVLHRGMALYDAAFGDAVEIDGIAGRHCATSAEVRRRLEAGDAVAVTPLALTDLIVIDRIDALIDARAHGEAKPDLRWLAAFSCGVGRGWRAGGNCDAAIGLPPEAVAPRRQLRAAEDGYWHSPIEPGMRVYNGFAVGQIAGASLRAPCDGLVLGILRDGLRVRADCPLIDIDPKPRQAQWNGLAKRGIAVAKAALAAIAAHNRAPLVSVHY